MPKVSIVMNCYDGEKYLKEAIDSVIAQTFYDWELILWDNQSTDLSAEIAKSYDDCRIKYFYALEHTMLGEARNLALEKCTGEYVSFLDTDDMWLPSKLEKQLNILESKSDVGLCYTGAFNMCENGNIISIYSPKEQIGFLTADLLDDYSIYMQSVLIRMSALSQIEEPNFDTNLKFAPDYDLFIRFSMCYKFAAISEALIKYRIVSNSLTSKTKEFHGYEMLYALDKLEKRHAADVLRYSEEIKIAKSLAACEYFKYYISRCEFFIALTHTVKIAPLFYKLKFKHIYRLLRAIDTCGVKTKIKRVLNR